MNKEELDVYRKELDDVLEVLGKHWEAVEILCSTVEPDGSTQRLFKGIGNWYARKGMVMELLSEEKSRDIAHALKEVLPPPPPPDRGEEWKG